MNCIKNLKKVTIYGIIIISIEELERSLINKMEKFKNRIKKIIDKILNFRMFEEKKAIKELSNKEIAEKLSKDTGESEKTIEAVCNEADRTIGRLGKTINGQQIQGQQIRTQTVSMVQGREENTIPVMNVPKEDLDERTN